MIRGFGILFVAALVGMAPAGSAVAAVVAPAGGGLRANAPVVRAAGPRSQVNWPQFRFDDNHTGSNPFEKTLNARNVPALNVAWQAQLGDFVDYSSPAIVDGIAYIASRDGRLWAYPAEGCGQSLCSTPLWTSSNLSQIIDSPTVANGIVYVGSQTSPTSNDGKLNAFSAAGCGSSVCAPLWQGAAGADAILESSPAVANGVVYVGSFDGKLYAFNARGCGARLCGPLWRGATGGSIESTPTVANGIVYVGSDDGNLYAFNAAGCGGVLCKPAWAGGVGGAVFQSSPAIAKGLVYIASQHALVAFAAAGCHATSCAPLWQAIDNLNFFAGAPAVAGGRVYIGLENGVNVYAAKGCGQSTCPPLWSDFGAGKQASVQSSPTVANGVVYAGRNTGQVLAWKAGPCGHSTCSEIWSGFTNDPIVSSSPTVVNGKVYIGSADDSFPSDISGRLYVFGVR